jgi:hypothetical protein
MQNVEEINMTDNIVDVLKQNFGIDMSDVFPAYGQSDLLLGEKTLKELKWFYDFIATYKSVDIVEVGVRSGELTVFLYKVCEKLIPNNYRIHGIDLWERCGNAYGLGYLTYKQMLLKFSALKISDHPVSLIQKDSMASASLFVDNSLDLVIIDANHEYEHVSSDIKAWLPKLKSGGYMLCHDIYSPDVPDIPRAIKDIFGEINPIDSTSLCGYHIYKKP